MALTSTKSLTLFIRPTKTSCEIPPTSPNDNASFLKSSRVKSADNPSFPKSSVSFSCAGLSRSSTVKKFSANKLAFCINLSKPPAASIKSLRCVKLADPTNARVPARECPSVAPILTNVVNSVFNRDSASKADSPDFLRLSISGINPCAKSSPIPVNIP